MKKLNDAAIRIAREKSREVSFVTIFHPKLKSARIFRKQPAVVSPIISPFNTVFCGICEERIPPLQLKWNCFTENVCLCKKCWAEAAGTKGFVKKEAKEVKTCPPMICL